MRRARILSLMPAVYRDGVFEEVVPHGYGPLLALAHLELGDLAEAERVAGETIARTRATQAQPALVEALRVAALIALRQPCLAEVEVYLDEALPLARAMPYPYAEARLLHVYGQLQAERGEPEPARQHLEAALTIFQHLGAGKDVERITQRLAEIARG